LQTTAHSPVVGLQDWPAGQQTFLQHAVLQQTPLQISLPAGQHVPFGMQVSVAAQQLLAPQGRSPEGQHWPSSRQDSSGPQHVVS
jgi:hypothetical protein